MTDVEGFRRLHSALALGIVSLLRGPREGGGRGRTILIF